MKIIIIVLTFLSFFSCSERPKTEERLEEKPKIVNQKIEIPTFLMYGEIAPVGYLEEQDDSIARKFGFSIKRVAGCEVDDKLLDSIKTINQKNDAIMRKKYGNNWINNFEKNSHLKMFIPFLENSN